MIDLHIHTKFSDGTWSPLEVLQEAEKIKLEVISITDHDSVMAYEELKKIDCKNYFSGKIITGAEINTVYDGMQIEVLAYDYNYDKFKVWIKENYVDRRPDLVAEFNGMIASCKKHNLKLSNDIVYTSREWPIDTIFRDVTKYEENRKFFSEDEWTNVDAFYISSITRKDFPVYFDSSIHFPTLKEVADAVRSAGGKLFVAHIWRYNFKNLTQILDAFVEQNLIDGLEVFHSTFTDEQSAFLFDYCTKNNLFMSGGTDCHGNKKKHRKLGVGNGNMCIDKKIIANWISL